MKEQKFTLNQRVRILPNKHYPPTKASKGIRYGIIVSLTRHPGMWFVNEDRQSNNGEWSYLVASHKNPSAGAMWFSENGIEPMKKN